MEIAKNKIFIKFIIVGFLATFAFGCSMGVQMLIDQNQHSNMPQAECCDPGAGISGTGSDVMMIHNLPFINSTNFSVKILLLGISLFSSLLVSRFIAPSLEKYYLSAREKYGGFRLFNIFTFLFSQGIIHPKIY